MATTEAIAAFAAGRRTDPAGARELLEAEWDTVSAKVRAEAVQALRHSPSLADEPLLERALDDRAKTVREAAARVLDLLPGSARALRTADAAPTPPAGQGHPRAPPRGRPARPAGRGGDARRAGPAG